MQAKVPTIRSAGVLGRPRGAGGGRSPRLWRGTETIYPTQGLSASQARRQRSCQPQSILYSVVPTIRSSGVLGRPRGAGGGRSPRLWRGIETIHPAQGLSASQARRQRSSQPQSFLPPGDG